MRHQQVSTIVVDDDKKYVPQFETWTSERLRDELQYMTPADLEEFIKVYGERGNEYRAKKRYYQNLITNNDDDEVMRQKEIDELRGESHVMDIIRGMLEDELEER